MPMARTFVIAVPGLTLPFVIRAVSHWGVATATEVSTVGVVYTVLLGLLVYRQFEWRRIYPILVDTVSLKGAVMLIIGTATAMAWALTQSGFSQWLVSVMAGCRAARLGFSQSRLSLSSSWAASSKGSRRSCCLAHCCFRWPRQWACTRCIMQ